MATYIKPNAIKDASIEGIKIKDGTISSSKIDGTVASKSYVDTQVNDIPVEKGTGYNSLIPSNDDTNNAYGKSSTIFGHGNTVGNIDKIIIDPDDPQRDDDDAGYGALATGLSSTAKGRASHCEGEGCIAEGTQSHAEGSYTIANNKGEHSEGIFNVSNTGQGTNEQTIHSVGIGTSESDRKNAVEIMHNGDYYMLGVGGYQGTNPKTQDAKVKTTQEVINGKQDILKVGTNISIEDDEVSATGYKFNTELQSFAELPDILKGHYMDMGSELPPASITFTGAAGSITYNVGGESAASLNDMVGMMAFKIGDGPIALLTSYDPKSNTATFDKSLDENNDLSDTPFSKVYMYIQIAFSGDANATTYSFVDMAEFASAVIMEGGKIKIGNYPIATIVSIDAENHTITLDKTLDPDNAVSDAMFNYTISQNNTASGNVSHAEGTETTASGNVSHAEGTETTASGDYSHAEGAGSTAEGVMSHAEGDYTKTLNQAEHSEGKYNVSVRDKTIHTVGIGNSVETRKNAHEIHIDGKHYIYGIGGYDGTNSQTAGVKTLQEVVNNKQDKLTAGNGIEISSNNTITCNLESVLSQINQLNTTISQLNNRITVLENKVEALENPTLEEPTIK